MRVWGWEWVWRWDVLALSLSANGMWSTMWCSTYDNHHIDPFSLLSERRVTWMIVSVLYLSFSLHPPTSSHRTVYLFLAKPRQLDASHLCTIIFLSSLISKNWPETPSRVLPDILTASSSLWAPESLNALPQRLKSSQDICAHMYRSECTIMTSNDSSRTENVSKVTSEPISYYKQ